MNGVDEREMGDQEASSKVKTHNIVHVHFSPQRRL